MYAKRANENVGKVRNERKYSTFTTLDGEKKKNVREKRYYEKLLQKLNKYRKKTPIF